MRCILRIVVVTLFCLSLLCLLSMTSSADDQLPDFPILLSEETVTISSPASHYLVTGCADAEKDITLEICNTMRYGAVYHLTLRSADGQRSYIPHMTIDGGTASNLTITLNIEGDVVIGDLNLSGYKSADIRFAASESAKLTICSVCISDNAAKTKMSISDGTIAAPELPELYSDIQAGYTSDAPLAFTLTAAETDFCTLEFIIPGIPDRRIVKEVRKGDVLTDIPTAESDAARVFEGWSKTQQEYSPYDVSAPVTESRILYAYFHYHNYSEYRLDENEHWKVCSCGHISPDGKEHHALCRDESPAFLVSEADCTHPAVYRYSCRCGFISDRVFDSLFSPEKGHIEKTKGNEIVCAECGVHIRNISPEQDDDQVPAGDTDKNPDPLPAAPADDVLPLTPESNDNDSVTSGLTLAMIGLIGGFLLIGVLTAVIVFRRRD